MPKAAAPAAAPLPAEAMNENTPLSFLIKGITDLANRTGRKLSAQQQQQQEEEEEPQSGPHQAPAPGVLVSMALQGETKETFAPKEVSLPRHLLVSLGHAQLTSVHPCFAMPSATYMNSKAGQHGQKMPMRHRYLH